jgi:hypothetical protein
MSRRTVCCRRGGGEPDHDVLADERVRHAVVMLVGLGVIVDVDLRLDPFGVFVTCCRQRLHGRPIDRFEGRQPGSFLNGRLFKSVRSSAIAALSSAQREELAIAKAREDPSLHDENAHLTGSEEICDQYPVQTGAQHSSSALLPQ